MVKVIRKHLHLSIIGLIVAAALYGESLRPVLLPLNTNSQIIFSGLVTALGYDIGLLVDSIIKKIDISKKFQLNTKIKYFLIILIGIVAFFITQSYLNSQQLQRNSLKIETDTPNWIVIVLGSFFVAFLIHQIAILIRTFAKFCAAHIRLPFNIHIIQSLVWMAIASLGALITFILVIVVQVSLDISARPSLRETQKPVSTLRSGGPLSLISWEGIGQTGREFVSRDVELYGVYFQDNTEIETMEPIRIYAGIDNETDLTKRVDLIMREFERTRAFERSVVIMFTPSGSGWVNPVAIDAVEFITKSNSASVSLQYSNNQAIVQYIRDRELPGKASQTHL